jgi:hypothetical protein
MSSQQSTEACWLAHGKNWNFDWMFSVRHMVPTLKCAECMEKKTLCMYPSNKISFTFFLAIYNFQLNYKIGQRLLAHSVLQWHFLFSSVGSTSLNIPAISTNIKGTGRRL